MSKKLRSTRLAARSEPVNTPRRFVSVQSRGLFALPADVRKRARMDEPGAQVEVTERPDGVIELRTHLPHPADQSWFWTREWQGAEREVDEHIAAGDTTVHESAEAFLEHLETLEAES